MGNSLILDGAGYIGSHLVKELVNQGHGVVVLDNLSTGHQQAVKEGEFIQEDLGDQNLLNQIFSGRRR